ncbi:MAG: ZPR1 zinc finger domain-containing protein [Desulfurococcales archaeon]|nr:ZPR1 zinc finger domain-containing protein [Desulfurococcales archaeon]
MGEDWIQAHKTGEPKPIFRVTARCIACGRPGLEIVEYLYEVPYFGKVILGRGRCRYCGYRYSDVRIAEASSPKKIVVRVEGEKQLRYLLVKSAMATVYIRERGYAMTPGPASTGFITTVEGILYRFQEAIAAACRGREEKEPCRSHIEWIRSAIEGRSRFTLVICDPEGTSKAHGSEVEETIIDEECRGQT